MGGAVSAGVNNDELIDNLLEADYINSSDVERVFRAVDRGHYFTPEYKERAYRDLAWKCGNLHISAPCIYSRVMENLKLGPGMSFLNLGSGTGYLSTMAGLLLGSNGINHGVEIHEDVLNYSVSKLDEFILTSAAIDEYEFCEPKFINGNCLYLGGCGRQYDRVYCGAACPENHENYMKNLIKVGGILVMPINDQLLQICRTSDTNWESKAVLPVSFATLISGKVTDCTEPLKMPEADPLSLQDICRFAVRSVLRKIIDIEHPELKKSSPQWKRVKKKNHRRVVIPLFNGNSDGEDEHDSRQHSIDEDDEDGPVDDEQFLMDVSNLQTCTSIMEWSQILQGTSAQLLGAIEASCAAIEGNSYRSTPMDTQGKSADEDDEIMEDDDNYVISGRENSGRGNIVFDDMVSDDEFLSDVEELQNILRKSENPNNCDGGVYKQKTIIEDPIEQKRADNKPKREKMDSGVVEDIETGGSSSSSSSSITESGKDENNDEDDDDEGSCLEQDLHASSDNPSLLTKNAPTKISYVTSKISKPDEILVATGTSTTTTTNTTTTTTSSLPAAEEPNLVPVINYTTYMKEKIKLLPLPLTLKYYLNLNREF